MKHVEYAYTSGMGDSEIEERLQTAETGVLALSGDGDAYAFPSPTTTTETACISVSA